MVDKEGFRGDECSVNNGIVLGDGKRLLYLILPFLAKGAVLTETGGLFQYLVTFTEKASISTDEASTVCRVTTMTSITGLLPSLNIEEEVITENKSIFNSFYGMI